MAKRTNDTIINIIFFLYDALNPVADELSFRLCPLNNIKAPLVQAVCGPPQQETN